MSVNLSLMPFLMPSMSVAWKTGVEGWMLFDSILSFGQLCYQIPGILW